MLISDLNSNLKFTALLEKTSVGCLGFELFNTNIGDAEISCTSISALLSNIDALITHFNGQDKTGCILLCLHTSVTDVLYKQNVLYRLIKSIHLYQLAVPDNVFQRISSVPTLPFDILDINK